MALGLLSRGPPLIIKPPSPKQKKNEQALTIYAAFLCGLMLATIAARWLHGFCNSYPGPEAASHRLWQAGSKAYRRLFRQLERRAGWTWFGRPSYGLVLLVAIFAMANAALSVTTLASHQMNHFASRFGWLSAANMALCVFLGLKNTPLSPAAALSHAELNILHRIVGYAAVLLLLLHAVVYTVHFGRQGRWALLVEVENIEGIGAGVAMLVLLMGVYRHRGYEVFYASHIVGFLAALLLTALHRPNWLKKLPLVMLLIAGTWALDRVVRAARMLRNLVNNQAALRSLPDGAIQVLLKKPGAQSALPGSHCFLWIPRIRLFETHPFTIVSNGPAGLELVIKSQEGFTRAVSSFASRHPGSAVWASVDGPYGSLPDTEVYDKLVLVSGGSGAAFTFGLVNRVLDSRESPRAQSIDFVWTVKRAEHFDWFSGNLQSLIESRPAVRLKLYVTGEEPYSDVALEETQDLDEPALLPKRGSSFYETFSGSEDTDSDGVAWPGIQFARVDAGDVVREAVQTLGPGQRMLLAACGPSSLMDAVRDAADVCRTQLDCRIDVHCEDFGGSEAASHSKR